MMASMRSELRKLLTVRSTYIIVILVLLLVVGIGFYAMGWQIAGTALQDPNKLTNDSLGSLSLTVMGALVAVLLMTHEYRYNTIVYTLTSSPSRSRVLLSKIIAVSLFAVVLTAAIAILSPLASYLGVTAHGNTLVPQTLNFGDLAWRSLYYGWGYGMIGLLLAVLIRSQVGAIAVLFMLPTVVESLIGLLLKSYAMYLPFAAQGQIIGMSSGSYSPMAPGKAAIIFGMYLLVFWAVAWVLFLKRDAN